MHFDRERMMKDFHLTHEWVFWLQNRCACDGSDLPVGVSHYGTQVIELALGGSPEVRRAFDRVCKKLQM